MTIRYRKIFSILLVVAVAVVTGFSIGKIYLDQTVAPTNVTYNEVELRDSDSEVASLVAQTSNKGVMDFSAVQLFQIAEYNLSKQNKFRREMTGEVLSAGQLVNMRSIKIKDGDMLTYYKLSPSKNVMGIKTPKICSKISYNLKTERIEVVKDGVFEDNQAAPKDLFASFNSAGEVWSQEDYKKVFNSASPKASIMPYIISDKTVSSENCSQVVDNQDGTYTFEISLSGENLDKAACYYSYEILFSSGYSFPEWNKVKITVTVDSNFLFKTVEYLELYTVYNVPVMGKSGVQDTFKDVFTYNDDVLPYVRNSEVNV